MSTNTTEVITATTITQPIKSLQHNDVTTISTTTCVTQPITTQDSHDVTKTSTEKSQHRQIQLHKKNKQKSIDDTLHPSAKRQRDTMAEQQKTTYENLKRQKKGIYYNNSTSSIEINDIEDQNPIVHFNAIQERLYGKHPTRAELIRDTKFGKPNLNQSFNTNVDLWNILLPIAKSGFLEQETIDAISKAQVVMGHLFKAMERVAEVDFTPLRNIDEKYDDYTEIPDSYLRQYTACAIYYDFHMGSVMRYMGNNYINAHIDIEEVERRCKGIVPDKVLEDLIRLFTFGSPAHINGESTRKNFYDYWKYGNHSTVEKDMKKMIKTLLKEFKNQWMIPLPCWIARFIPHGHITPEGLVQKPHKKDRPVFDASALLFWYSICINMLTHTDNEPDIHYGETLIKILIRLWNLRITYPLEDILLMCDDIAGAFRIGKYNPEIISAFMYRIHKYIIVSTGQNFGSNFAPANFEPIAIAREKLAEHLFDDETLIEKHKELIDAILFDNTPLDPNDIVPAVPDEYNKGVLDNIGKPKKTPHNMFVDDNTVADIRQRMKQALAAGFEAIFIILGYPDISKRKSAIAMDKLEECVCGHEQFTLGMKINTRTMTIMRNPDKLKLLEHDLIHKWNNKRTHFRLSELASLKGRIQDMSQHILWAKTLFMDLHTSAKYAQDQNRKSVYNNKFYRSFINDSRYIGTEHDKILKARFAQKKLQKAIWTHPARHKLSKALRQNIKLMLQYLNHIPLWEVPIAHLVPRVPEFQSFGDACLLSGGGWSSDLRFWWFLEWPDDIKKRSIKFIYKFRIKDTNGEDKLISINIFEFIVAIIDYAGATFQYRRYLKGELKLATENKHPYPILKNWADNTSTVKWSKDLAYKNKTGKALSKVLGALNFGNKLGLDSHHLSGDKNIIADNISRFHLHIDPHKQFLKLKQEHPILKDCQHLIPTQDLTSILYSALRQPEAFELNLENLPVETFFEVINDSS